MAMPTRSQRPESTNGETAEPRTEPEESDAAIEQIVESMIQSETEQIEADLEELERRIETVDNFARISLNERKVKQNEVNLAEFSDSLMGFAEKAFNNINRIEDRVDFHALLLASILDALSEEGVDVDLTEEERYQQENVVVSTTPEEQLESALERF